MNKQLLLTFCLAASAACAAPASLHECVAANDFAALQQKLANPAVGLNDRDEAGNTALHLAAQAGAGEFCRALVAAGADVTALNAVGKTPQQVAADAATADICEGEAAPAYTMEQLNQGEREQRYRRRVFRAYLSGEQVQQRYKTDAYSPLVNPTGIYFKAGEKVRITVNGAFNKPLRLIINDVHAQTEPEWYKLRSGSNEIRVEQDGLGYFDYRDEQPETCPPVTVEIEGGTVNGIVTPADDAATAQRMLENAAADVLDLCCDRVLLVLPVRELKEFCPKGQLPALLQSYGNIIRSQQELMGYGEPGTPAHPNVPMYGRVTWNGYMFADEKGAGFHLDNMISLCNPALLTGDACWGVAHEFGHLNQVRPGFCWQGMTEVTNNLYALWYQHGQGLCSRIEGEMCNNADEMPMVGGHLDAFVNCAVVRQEPWQFQHHGATPHPYVAGDVFATLAPLWQMLLYAEGRGDRFADLFDLVRGADDRDRSNGELRMAFLKHMCDVFKLNLTAYFRQCGMLQPISRGLYDYGDGWLTVTEEMVRGVEEYAARYPQPDSPVLCYLNSRNRESYLKHLPAHAPVGEAPAVREGRMEIPAGLCGAAVAYECWRGNTLLRVSLPGLNHENSSDTTVVVPDGTTAVKAVQWDGTRYLVREIK